MIGGRNLSGPQGVRAGYGNRRARSFGPLYQPLVGRGQQGPQKGGAPEVTTPPRPLKKDPSQ